MGKFNTGTKFLYEIINLLRGAKAIFEKDLKSELRTRFALNAILMFGVTTLASISFAIGPFSVNTDLLSALFWIVLFFSSMSGLSQVFVKEEETRTSNTLKLVAEPNIIFLGKLVFNIFLLFLLEIVLVPLFIILMNMKILNFGLFFILLFLGSICLAGATTIIAGIISKASMKGALFAVLSFPILLPLLIVEIKGTRISLLGGAFLEASDELKLLIVYAGIMLTLSFLLFEFVWNE
jgi:heme exporter protein B